MHYASFLSSVTTLAWKRLESVLVCFNNASLVVKARFFGILIKTVTACLVAVPFYNLTVLLP